MFYIRWPKMFGKTRGIRNEIFLPFLIVGCLLAAPVQANHGPFCKPTTEWQKLLEEKWNEFLYFSVQDDKENLYNFYVDQDDGSWTSLVVRRAEPRISCFNAAGIGFVEWRKPEQGEEL